LKSICARLPCVRHLRIARHRHVTDGTSAAAAGLRHNDINKGDYDKDDEADDDVTVKQSLSSPADSVCVTAMPLCHRIHDDDDDSLS